MPLRAGGSCLLFSGVCRPGLLAAGSSFVAGIWLHALRCGACCNRRCRCQWLLAPAAVCSGLSVVRARALCIGWRGRGCDDPGGVVLLGWSLPLVLQAVLMINMSECRHIKFMLESHRHIVVVADDDSIMAAAAGII